MPTPLQEFLPRLNALRDRLASTSTTGLFNDDPDRFTRFSVNLGRLVFDYSKNRVDSGAIAALLELADAAGVAKTRDAMLGGQKINSTEGRAVLHTALRNRADKPVLVEGRDVMPDVQDVLGRMDEFAREVRSGQFQVSGGKVRDVVNIGIGGSDLGPRMVAQALAPWQDGPRLHFVANIDGADISDTLVSLDPATTLFIVASKSFTTQETMINARSAFSWVEKAVGSAAAEHFCALSTNLEATREFGIPDERTFGFWNWVGGRYSVWSAIGLSVMIGIGPENFRIFLEGAHQADRHFQEAPFEQNIPVLMAMLGIWHRNVCSLPAHAVLPYDNRLARFPAWLQQLDMESNGKAVTIAGDAVNHETGPIIFGEPGTNGQHAFYQLIHQGTTVVPCDFLVAANPVGTDVPEEHHRLMLANCLAQSEALMTGRTLEEAGGDPHKVFSGNRPSNTLLYDRLDPFMLGTLMALYEHKVFVQGIVWGINSFDQWGVELGKQLAQEIEPMLAKQTISEASNSSTGGLVRTILGFRARG